MPSRVLQVYISGIYAGNVTQNETGELSFSYSKDYSGVPLSVCMPPRNKAFGDKIVRPFLLGLLPDAAVGDPFDLLADGGFDCQGAAQFVVSSTGADSSSITPIIPNPNVDDLIALSNADIARRLQGDFDAASEHWTLSGRRTKFTLRFEDGTWYSATNTSATTHIFKAGNPDHKNETLNEYICMRLAECVGIPTAPVQYRRYCLDQGDEYNADGASVQDRVYAALIVERFDRKRAESNSLKRTHFEDFCQACAVVPAKRYASAGGPNTNDIIAMLKRTGGGTKDSLAVSNILQFCSALFFNYLIGSTDAHAKNYGLQHLVFDAYGTAAKAGVATQAPLKSSGIPYIKFAPLYDAISAFPYESVEDIKLAMAIGNADRVGSISRASVEDFVQTNDLAELSQSGFALTADNLCRYWSSLAARVKEKLPFVFDEMLAGCNPDMSLDLSIAGDIVKLQDVLMPYITANCEHAIGALR